MPLVITLTQRQDGMDCATHGFFAATSRHGATMALARILVDAGFPDEPWQACSPDGKPRFSGKSLLRLASLTIAEGDRRPVIMPFQRPGEPVGGLKSETSPGDRAEM